MTIPAAIARRREYAGPAIFSYDFRPFFLGGAILLWIPLHAGSLQVRTIADPLVWHAHEMLYGYVPAIVAGFLLTAIPNWTGRLPVCGLPLAGLFLLWLIGRVAMLMAGCIGMMATAAIDIAFLVVLAAVAMREIIAGKNWRNMRVLAVVALLIAGNVVFHVEMIATGAADYGIRLGIAAVILLIALVGGRIIPSFTRNWLVRENPGRLPVPFGRYDIATVAVSVVAFAIWIASPFATGTGALMMFAGLVHIVRLARWAGDRTLRDRLVLVLHVAYGFVPVGFLLAGAAAFWPDAVPTSAGIHAWTVGAIGLMTMAVMTRASLGHTGQPLIASPLTQAIYVCLFLAAGLRIVAAFGGGLALMHTSATAWTLAFGMFAVSYGPRLMLRPPNWRRA